MIAPDFADRFAAEWIAAWNAHDLERILTHYADDFEMSSPIIRTLVGETSGTLKGKPAVRAYWQKALGAMPDLHFEHLNTLVGAHSIMLYYKGPRGFSGEVFHFGADGKIVKAFAHYTAFPPTRS